MEVRNRAAERAALEAADRKRRAKPQTRRPALAFHAFTACASFWSKLSQRSRSALSCLPS